MKNLLFNIYKVSYIKIHSDLYKKYPQKKPDSFGELAASAGVFLFLFLLLIDIWLITSIVWKFGPSNLNKPIIWLLMLLGVYLCYLLLFKVLGLEPHNYCEPEYRPDQSTIRRTWIIWAIVGAATAILMALQLYLRQW